jgi:hypothetical protein
MNNNSIEFELNNCNDELNAIEHLILGLGTSQVCLYLLKYAVIRSCSCIEHAFKNLIADYYEAGSPRVASFISRHVRENSKNPSYEAIYDQLNEFDSTMATSFKNNFLLETDHERYKGSLKSLKNLRNDVAHGTNITTSIAVVKTYFSDSRKIIECLDRTLDH